MKKRLLLIAPAVESMMDERNKRRAKRIFHIYRGTLSCLAGLTPDDWEVTLVDESVEDVCIQHGWDVVGITVSTFMAQRAYELSRQFQELGSVVVLGGIHPTAVPEEAIEHCDVVVRGEAEYIWGEVLRDIENGRAKRVYSNELCNKPPVVDPKDFAVPRHDLLKGKSLFTAHTMQASRGCNNRCEFCSVGIAGGRGLRPRPLGDIAAELATVRRRRTVYFLDDNLFHHPEFRTILDLLKARKLRWCAQLPINAFSDPDVYKHIGESRCRAVTFGIDSLAIAAKLKQASGITPLEAVQRAHDMGIVVAGSFVFGFDHDEPSVFNDTLEFCFKAGLEFALFHIMTPYPGTPLFRKLQRRGSLYIDTANTEFDYPWHMYNTTHAVFRPRNMTADQLEDGFLHCVREFHRWRGVGKRMDRLASTPLWALGGNLLMAKGFKPSEHYLAERDRFREVRGLGG